MTTGKVCQLARKQVAKGHFPEALTTLLLTALQCLEMGLIEKQSNSVSDIRRGCKLHHAHFKLEHFNLSCLCLQL